MTQIDKIRRVLSEMGSDNLFDTAEIESKTDFPRASIRRILGSLVRFGEIRRVESGLFATNKEDELDEEYHRKFIGTTKYRGDPRQFFAITYEKNDIDREGELLAALGEYLNERYVQSAGNTGYSDEHTERRDVQFNFEYPNIQVGEL